MLTSKNRCLLLAIPTWLVISRLTYAAPAGVIPTSTSRFDSIGVERRDGRRYVLHRVDQGQTLFAVARRYHVSVDAIRTANPDLGEGNVRYDQLLRVPVEGTTSRKEQREADRQAAAQEKAARKEARDKTRPTAETERTTAVDEQASTSAKPAASPASGDGTHVVESGQTLYGLAARYGVSMAELRQWNNLGADGIQVGKTLIVSEKAYLAKGGQPKAVSHKAETSPSKTKSDELAKLDTKPLVTPDPPLAPGSKPKPKSQSTESRTQAAEPTERTQPTRPAEPVASTRPAPERTPAPKTTEPSSDNEPVAATTRAKGGSSVKVQSEIGFADVIEGDSQSSKYLALHRSAPVGTLVQVRNDISNQSLYVKVVGKLPDTGLNDQVLIRLSNRAFEKLSPNGQRFRAEVSYTK